MTTWIETTKERYDEMLDVLPPARMTIVGFLVGEAMDHGGLNNAPRFSAFAHTRDGKFYEAKEVMTTREFAAIRLEDVPKDHL